ncbi:hypothetical protein ACIGZH_07970 [Streptomyces sp. NPDC058319]|uniref:hypothetical protein n=1 Tax=unclassified Streptomyces TaxID=2593676 RepID=UPI0036EA60E8
MRSTGPVCRRRRRPTGSAYAAEGHAVEVNEMTLDAASYVLEYDFDASRRSPAR